MSRGSGKKFILAIKSPGISPHELFNQIRSAEHCFLLESGMPHGNLSRYSIMGANPFFTLKGKGGSAGAPLHALKTFFNKYREAETIPGIPYNGGAVGFLGYNLNSTLEEKVKPFHPDRPVLPDLYFMFMDSGAVFDHINDSLFIFALPIVSAKRAEEKFDALKAAYEKALSLKSCLKAENLKTKKMSGKGIVRKKYLTDKKDYLASIKKAKKYISAGDIYEVNLSHRMEIECSKKPWDVYLSLRAGDPTPFAAYMKFGKLTIVSASPERFLSLRGDNLETRPIKGTMPRGKTIAQDKRLSEKLGSSVKNRAENIMIVDLSRNDIGRVCDFGSVKAEKLMEIEGYSRVFQMVSTISGKLSKGKDAFDCIRACFPGGSMTGTPKIRAMQIIEELEPVRRGIYSGSLGYISFNGDMDLNIIIRTLVFWRGKAYLQVGGAIVADSNPEKEYMETMYKAESLLEALK
ncbi:MAG: aminodeoxychorismate synthase component I [Candidatus Schekmanbacteria bacterium]|nr:aminodeoxychorismate synthase component I [Candidatus Schekmanbacteria bacterium]